MKVEFDDGDSHEDISWGKFIYKEYEWNDNLEPKKQKVVDDTDTMEADTLDADTVDADTGELLRDTVNHFLVDKGCCHVWIGLDGKQNSGYGTIFECTEYTTIQYR